MQNQSNQAQPSAANAKPASASSAKKPAQPRAARNKSRNAVVAAMLSAVAFVLMFLQFPIPFLIPAFVQMDVSDLPALIGAFALHPVYGIVISLLKNILHMLIKGSSTAGAGELCNFVLGASFSFVAGAIYHRNKSKNAAMLGAVVGAVVMGVLSVPLNYFITYPVYEVAFGMPMDVILGMYQALLPAADTLLKCLLIFNMPFTICKGLLCALLCVLVYKPLSPLLHGKR